MADNNLFTLRIITPDRVFFEGQVSMVEFNTTEGEIGIYKKHVPTTVIISPGILTITGEEGVKEAALHASQQNAGNGYSQGRNGIAESVGSYSCY